MTSFRRLTTAISLSIGSLFSQGSKISFMGTKAPPSVVQEVAEEIPQAVAATVKSPRAVAGAAAVGGAGLLGLRACEREGGELLVSGAGSAGAKSLVEEGGSKGAAEFGEDAFGSASKSHLPEYPSGEPFPAVESMRTPILVPAVGEDGASSAARQAVQHTKIVLYDGSGKVIPPSSLSYSVDQVAVQDRLVSITADTLKGLPDGGAKLTDAQIRSALTKALNQEESTATSRFAYEFDGTKGTLKVKVKMFGDAEFSSGDIEVYPLVKKAATKAAGLGMAAGGGYVASMKAHHGGAAVNRQPQAR